MSLLQDAIEHKPLNLTTFRTTRMHKRVATLTGLEILLISLIAAPFADRPAGELQAFLPIVISIGIFSQLFTSYLLIRQFRVLRMPGLAVLASTYLFSSLIAVSYLLTFPGVFSEWGLFGANVQTSAWLWIFWHVGFPLGIFAYLRLERHFGDAQMSRKRANRTAWSMFTWVLALIVALTLLAVFDNRLLPNLVAEGQYNKMATSGIGLLACLLNLLAFAALLLAKRGQTVLQLWLSVAMLASTFDVGLTLLAGGWYTIGWYVTRVNSLLSSSIVLGALIYEINRLYYNLTESEQRLKSLYLNNPDAVYTLDMEGRFLSTNPACEKITGYKSVQLVDKKFRHVIPQEECERMREYFLLSRQGETNSFEVEVLHAQGHRVELHVKHIPIIVDGRIAGVYGIGHDITESKRAEATIHHLAYHDPLTGLPNRRLFKEQLGEAVERAQEQEHSLAVLFLDLDRFKMINDTFGHDMGDELLREVTSRLIGCVREQDVVARIGGDEFTLMLPGANADVAREVAGDILAALQRPVLLGGQEVHVTTSIGIALHPNDAEDPEMLMRYADTAMYRAKEQGKNNCQLYGAYMKEQAYQRLTMENDMRKALERDEFRVYYQAQIDAASGRVTGAEALLRWLHPERGIVSPAQFIPVAEETGMIVPIGEWVLRTACRDALAWERDGLPPLRVAVNLSLVQFRHSNLIEMVSRALADTGLDPHRLELEITESIAMHQVERVVPTLQELRRLGVEIAMDDFGTGYSSLSYLKNFPIQRLKIDQSFVRGLKEGSDDAAIVTAIIALAHSLHLDVIAEGVEEEEQVEFLRRHGCQFMQGYRFHRPVPEEQLREFLAEKMERL
jgi:diguanylate cyclase (GGDEF)-like protein/PAS domain S-box-containing protein